MTFHNTWYNWCWTETILENISNFLSLIHPTEQLLEILFATGSNYVVHPRLALNVVSFHLSLKHCDHRCPRPGFPYESHWAVCFPTIYRIKEAKAGREITDMRKQCYANQAITKAHQEAWGQLQKNVKNTSLLKISSLLQALALPTLVLRPAKHW